MNCMRVNYNDCVNFTIVFAIFTAIVVVNILSIVSVANLLVTLPQYCLVLYLLFAGKVKESVLFHFTFCMLGLSAQGTLGMMESMDFRLYNYAGLKLVGPVRASYMMNILYVLFLMRKKDKLPAQSLFCKLFKIVSYLCISAIIIGVFGLLVNKYYSSEAFVDRSVYAFVLLSTMFILKKVADTDFLRSAYYFTIASIMSGITASFICYITGDVVSHYSVYDIAYMADVTMLALVLVIGIPYIKQRGLLWLSLIMLGGLMVSSLGGKGAFGIAFSILALGYLIFFDSSTKQSLKNKNRFLRPAVIILTIGAVFYILRHFTTESMAGYKMVSAMSMFSGNLDSMSRSPYIRIASLLNILNDGLSNPLALLFGNGYGGYFEDNLHLFAGIDLSNGAFKDDVIASGKFTYGHDAIVTVPLFNGLIGLYLIIKIVWLYIKRIPYNYLNSVSFFWIAMMFYFSTNAVFIGCFALVAAEYDLLGLGNKGSSELKG